MDGMDWFHLVPNGKQRKHVVNVVTDFRVRKTLVSS
jgi:hypothetical protein